VLPLTYMVISLREYFTSNFSLLDFFRQTFFIMGEVHTIKILCTFYIYNWFLHVLETDFTRFINLRVFKFFIKLILYSFAYVCFFSINIFCPNPLFFLSGMPQLCSALGAISPFIRALFRQCACCPIQSRIRSSSCLLQVQSLTSIHVYLVASKFI
jgi:hypothetical protein